MEIKSTQRIVLERHNDGWKAIVESIDGQKDVFVGNNLALMLADTRQPRAFSLIEGSMVPENFANVFNSGANVGLTCAGHKPGDFHDVLETSNAIIEGVLNEKEPGFIVCWHASQHAVKGA